MPQTITTHFNYQVTGNSYNELVSNTETELLIFTEFSDEDIARRVFYELHVTPTPANSAHMYAADVTVRIK